MKKSLILISLLIVISLCYGVFAFDPTDARIKAWYKMDEVSGDIASEINLDNFTSNGALIFRQAGIAPGSDYSIYRPQGNGVGWIEEDAITFPFTTDRSHCFFMWRIINGTNDKSSMSCQSGGQDGFSYKSYGSGSTYEWIWYNGGTPITFSTGYATITNSEHLIGVCHNGTHGYLSINDTVVWTQADANDIPTATIHPCYYGSDEGGNNGDAGVYDDWMYIEKTTAGAGDVITQLELTDLWTNWMIDAATFEEPTPADGGVNNTQVNINVSCSEGNVTLWFDNNVDPTNRTININGSDVVVSPANFTTAVVTTGTYYYKASCNNGTSNSTVRSWIYDIQVPYSTLNSDNFFNRINTSSMNFGESQVAELDITFLDNNDLFGFELNITNSTGKTIYNLTIINLTGTSDTFESIIDVSSTLSGTFTVNLTVWDSHTVTAIPNYDVKKGNDYVEFNGNIKITADGAVSTDTTKEEDRYAFEFNYAKDYTAEKIFYIESDNKLYYKPNSGYKAHFVDWETKKWIDFEGLEQSPIVTKVNNNKYKIEFNNADDKLTFSSIGGLNFNETAYTYTLTGAGIDNCTGGGFPTINFTMVNESRANSSVIEFGDISMDFFFEYYSTSISGIKAYDNYSTAVEIGNISFCINPNSSSVVSNITVDYVYEGTHFTYQPFELSLSNSTKSINLYVADGTTAITLNVKDTFSENIEDVYITIEKWDVGENTFKATEIVRTDTEGNALARIVLSTEWYRFRLKYRGITRLIDGPVKIIETTRDFRINLIGQDWYDEFSVYQGIVHNLSFNNGTKLFVFHWDDPQSTISQACLKVTNINVTGNTILSDVCTVSTSGSRQYDIGTNATVIGKTYFAEAYVTINSNNYIIDSTTISFDTRYTIWESSPNLGLFVTLLLVITLAFAGLWHPGVSMILALLGMGVMKALGFYYIAWPMYSLLVILAIVIIGRTAKR